ncbi:Gfo/Idh/MocA family protein [Falsibacillus albus]|uniref:Gfo/Idh/MocA family oxidoreductase n=1 Tax=Falsibacillus albus TaxID=2478915 RepID=A0A3L7K5D2_9BACI|nr:Gfo/Idh/MocA family oxidoreductase [Falsibacillus albus]RLQ97474.1 gfo/Idh/MocA family oxidoreductase [Falsibacillus albus]
MNKLRLGIIGVGGIAIGRHIPAFQKLSEQAAITAVTDVNLERAESVAKEFKIPHAFESYQDMFPHVDAVVICTPNKFHAEITVKALEAGLHVLCEKPMAMTTAEAEQMVEASKRAGKVLSIGFHYRFMKESQAAKKVILENEIGQPIVVRIQALRRRKVPGWGVFTNKSLQGGGSLIDYGCHLLDLALWLIGNPEPVEVSGTAYNILSKQPDQVNLWGTFNHETFDVDDHVTSYVRFDNNVSLMLETTWAANIEEDQETLSISGDQGGLDVFPFRLNYAKHGMLFNSAASWIPGEEDYGLEQARNFVGSCLGQTEQLVKPEEALHVTKIIEAIYESSEKKRSIILE